jgi:hypothetical protein
MFGKPIRLLAALVALTFTAPGLQAADHAPKGYSVSVEFTPVKDDPTVYGVQAVISDVDTQEVLFSPKVTAKKGESAKVSIGNEPGALTLDILLDKAGTVGTYTFTAKKSGKTVSVQKGSISIR